MTMTHPGLPLEWALWVMVFMLMASAWALLSPAPLQYPSTKLSLQNIPVIGRFFRYLVRHTWLLLVLKIIFVALFLLVIIAGLWGSAIPERNLATTLTWNLWWGGIVIAVLFTGSAWCALCPWDTISSWLVKHRLWQRSNSKSQLGLKVPPYLRNVWPATLLFVGLSWLELGIDVTSSPYATSILALLMVVLATLAMTLFENKAFCRYFCPVGRTVGVYSQLAPIALRPVDDDICQSCKSLDCYHGSTLKVDKDSQKNGTQKSIAPCPTHLVMGRLKESTYCTSCGNCTQSCPSKNINWALRSPSVEAIQEARPHFDEAFFMLTLLVLTSFHGLTMLEGWQGMISQSAQWLSTSSIALAPHSLLISFTMGLIVCWLLPISLYAAIIWLSERSLKQGKNGDRKKDSVKEDGHLNWAKLFSGFAFVAIPLAFSYHIAHNLNHLLREGSDWFALLSNPLGIDALPLSMAEKHMRHMGMLISEHTLFTLQAILLVIGFYLAIQVIRYRAQRLFALHSRQVMGLIVFAIMVTGGNLWLLMQDMVMRM